MITHGINSARENFSGKKHAISRTIMPVLPAERFPHKPLIMEMANATALLGGSVELRCSVISDLTPYIQWRRHFTDVNGSYVNLTSGLAYTDEIQVSCPVPVSFCIFVLLSPANVSNAFLSIR